LDKLNLLLLENIFDFIKDTKYTNLEEMEKDLLTHCGILFYSSGFKNEDLKNIIKIMFELQIISVDFKPLVNSTEDIFPHLLLLEDNSFFLGSIVQKLIAERKYQSDFVIKKNNNNKTLIKQRPTLF